MEIKPVAMRDAFLNRIWQAMSEDPKIFFASADFGSPVLDKIRADFPSRFVNVGIAEQNLINVSAGLALEGFKVFAYAIAPFITMRCYEQTRINLALLSSVRSMNVTLIGVGAGYSYVISGPTHQCYEDITLMRALTGFSVFSPADHIAAAALFDSCAELKGPKYVRLDAQILPVIYQDGVADIHRGFQINRSGTHICLVTTGFMLHTALKVADALQEKGCSACVIDMFDLSHFDADALEASLKPFDTIVTIEEGVSGRGGLDSLVFDFLATRARPRILNLGVTGPFRFDLGSRLELHEQVGIGPIAVLNRICNFININ